MNLLRRRVEMPMAVWKDEGLTCDEKVLLAIVASSDERSGIVLTPADISETLGVPKPKAANMLKKLKARGDVAWGKRDVRHRRVSLGSRFAGPNRRVANREQLKMSFIQCLCGYDLRMDHIDQLRVCPECRRVVYYTVSDKSRLSR